MIETYKLTKSECPESSRLLWISDVHVGIEHRPALEVAINLAEDVGVTHNIAGGDIYDCHAISKHEKDPERIIAQGTLAAEAASGQYFTDWLSTRPCYFIGGNHEGRINRFVAENPSLYGLTIRDVLKLPASWKHIEVGGCIRLGNLVLSHGDAEFKKSTGGKYPANKLLEMAPDQSSIVGHLHRMTMARRTSRDEDGIPRTRAAWTMGHMSREEKHYGYVSRHIGWQMGFGIIDVFWEGTRPRWHVSQIEVLFDRYNRPYCMHGGKVYR